MDNGVGIFRRSRRWMDRAFDLEGDTPVDSVLPFEFGKNQRGNRRPCTERMSPFGRRTSTCDQFNRVAYPPLY